MKKFWVIILSVGYLLVSACSNTRHLQAGNKLYTGANVIVSGPSLPIQQRKVLREDLNGLTRPKPNSKLLGMRFKLSIYNMFRNKKEKSFFGKIRDKNG